MWQTDISVCKEYGIGGAIERSLRHASITFESCILSDRYIFSIIDKQNKRNTVENIITNIILVDYKYKYFVDVLGNSNSDNERLLMSEMLFFDSKYEHEYLEKVLCTQYDYSIDGIVTFKLMELRENWDYLISLYTRVSKSSDGIITLAEYIHDSAIDENKKIYMTEKHGKIIMFDVKSGETVKEVTMMSTLDDNILMMLVSTHASELYVDKRCKFKVPGNVLNKVIAVKYV